MKTRSIAKNAVLNVILNVSNIAFSLITFPYVSRVLGVDALGQYNFAKSVISYFVLIAGLGIGGYAIREGSRLREDKEKISAFASEMLAINIVSTTISYIALFLCLVLVRKFDDYRLLIFIFSFQIIMSTIGVEWIYSIYEDFTYITLRTLGFKVLSIVLLFVFVRTKDDVVNYAIVTVIALCGSGIFNLVHSGHYCDLNLKRIKGLKKHFKPILTIFSASIAIMIYVSSDTTILGFLKSDYEVGLYSLASKIYMIIKSVISSILIVSIPRLSALYGNNEIERYNRTLQKVIDTISVFLFPCVVGLFLLSENIVVLVGGSDYVDASMSLKILSVALLFCLYGWIFNQCVLMPSKNEKTSSIATIASASVNIIFNFLLIPIWGEKAAALTTVLAELMMFIICYRKGRKLSYAKVINVNLLQVIVGCVGISIICILCRAFINNNIVSVGVAIPVSVIAYGIILLLLGNEQIKEGITKIIGRDE